MKFTSVLGFGLFTMSQTNASDLNRFKFTLIFFSLSAIQTCSCKVSLKTLLNFYVLYGFLSKTLNICTLVI